MSDNLGSKPVVALAVDDNDRQTALDRALDQIQDGHRLATAGGAEHQGVGVGVGIAEQDLSAAESYRRRAAFRLCAAAFLLRQLGVPPNALSSSGCSVLIGLPLAV